MSVPINLDGNATTPPHPAVIETVVTHLQQNWGNPGSRHAIGRRARRVLDDSRETIAAILDAEFEEVVFTSGGTESNNLAIQGLAVGSRRRLVTLPGEHPATRETCRHLQQRGWTLATLPIDTHGQWRVDQLEAIVTAETGLVTALLAHNETGVRQNLEPLVARCQTISTPLHVDAVQAVGRIPVSFRNLSATTLSFAAHKFHGLRGVGGLLVRRGTQMAPLLFGGHQESERRPGTEAVALAAGMAKALELWQQEAVKREAHMGNLRDRLEAALEAQLAPVVVQGKEALRLPNTSCVAFPGVDGEALLVNLDLAGVACSLGSTCASGSAEPAEILLAMGCSPEVARASVRFSLTAMTTETEVEQAIERIVAAVSRLRGRELA